MKEQNTYQTIVDFIKATFNSDEIALHPPIFGGNEQKYVADAINNTNVASRGKYIGKFEKRLCELTGAKHAIVVSSGTSALHIALKVAGVEEGDEVLTQSLSFIATANAISYCGASPHFIDIDRDTLGLSPSMFKNHLSKIGVVKNGRCYNKKTNKRISACVPMHTFGNPMRIKELVAVCDAYGINVIEDAAQALGSLYENQPIGTFGKLGVFSFNGNKICTSGGGGAVITDDMELAKEIRFLINQAKEVHQYGFNHSKIGFNYRMPNLNAALGYAQLEQLDAIILRKKELHQKYKECFADYESVPIVIGMIEGIREGEQNHWMQTILFNNPLERDNFVKFTHQNKIQTRVVWTPLHQSEMYRNCERTEMKQTEYAAKRLVNLPSNF